jgi:hypothetical protein
MTDISVNTQDLSQAQPAGPSLNIQDIVGLLSIVDVASRRGAFRAEELSSVGQVYDKVSAFLKSTGVIQDPAAPENEETAETEQ